MLVGELRETIKKYTGEEKDKIIVELYKRIPKDKKEDYGIDDYIKDINNVKKTGKEDKTVSFEELCKEVDYFIKCAYQDLYVSPNRIINKSERSKWRFKVKKFYKELVATMPDTEDGIKATELLNSLYYLMSNSSVYLKFTTWKVFSAINVSQAEFLETVMKRILILGINKENMIKCARLLDVEYDPYEFHVSLLLAFTSCLKTADARYMAIDALKEMVDEKIIQYKSKKSNDYDLKTIINYFVECIVYLYADLCEVDNGIKYFHKYYIESRKEIKEYVVLEMLEMLELYDEWIKEYEKYQDINYRDSMKEKYKEIKNKLEINM